MRKEILNTVVILALLASSAVFAQTSIEIDATSGSITSPFAITNGCICQAISTDVAESGRAVFSFTITNGGSYVIIARVAAATDRANSFYVNVDGEPQDTTMLWDIPATAGFTNRVISWRGNGSPSRAPFSRKAFALSSGKHELIIRGSSANTKLAHISIGRIPAPAGNLRVVTAP